MAKMPDHLHKYKKINLARKKGKDDYWVYQCEVPTCTHYIPIKMSIGKLCECSRCHNPMIITRDTLFHSGGKPMLRPYCAGCVKTKKVDDVEALTDYISKLAPNS